MTAVLGKKPARHDPRTLRYAQYRTGALTPPPVAHWGHGLPFAMLGNGPDPGDPPAFPDGCGDCVEAGYAHFLQVICDRAGQLYVPSTAAVLGAYSAITGFNPDDQSTDEGTDMLAACQHWRSTGLDGRKVTAYMSVSPLDVAGVQESVAFYGGCYTGLQLPLSARSQQVWDVATGPDAAAGSWGGHCVVITGYDRHQLFFVTWGQIQAMTWAFFRAYCDEAYALLSRDWIAATGASPSGLAWGQLMADLYNL